MHGPIAYDSIARLISTIGKPSFPAEYFSVFRDPFHIQQCTVFAFRGEASPTPLIVEVESADMRSIAQVTTGRYVCEGFERDPNIRCASRGPRPRVSTLDVDQIEDRGYRHEYYETGGLAHELILIGNAGNVRYYSSFYRTQGEDEFSLEDRLALQEVANLTIQTLHRHADCASRDIPAGVPQKASADARKLALEHLRDVLLREPQSLTPREAEVCAAIVLGYSTLAIGLNCGISINTVATHRKRAYAKLGICSQNDLFSRYFAAVARHRAQLAP
ncbi:MAG TPA: LuxR C-terminal-related transcriptional regulator [Steroidobacteraceae bacterium]|nr:LuxR C-terminal-related transcriptional regulator [Steroidobacteraceae bacterium]